MRWHRRMIPGLFLAALAPISLFAQSNICEPATGARSNEERIELLRIQAEDRARQELMRANWVARILPISNPDASFRALCVFGVEVIPQPRERLLAVRAPKELMPSIEDALKRLDVPPPPEPARPAARSVELTAYVLVVSEVADSNLMPVPDVLQPAANQLKALLPSGNIYLEDTVVIRGREGYEVQIGGSTRFTARLSIRDDTPPVVALTQLVVMTNNAQFNTNVDVPVGAQVVVGKASSTDPKRRAIVLVITARLLN